MPHKFIAYRAVETEVISAMRGNQHEVFYAAEQDQQTTADALCQKANGEQYILLTGDKAFAEELYEQQRVQSGIILVDVPSDNVYEKAKAVLSAIQEQEEQLLGTYTTILPKRVKSKAIKGA